MCDDGLRGPFLPPTHLLSTSNSRMEDEMSENARLAADEAPERVSRAFEWRRMVG